MFDEISILRRRLHKDRTLDVVHAAHQWTASFEWHPQATENAMIDVQSQLAVRLPSDYISFLTTISDGAVLFKEMQYSQWGFILYGTSTIIQKQAFWQRNLNGRWTAALVAIGETLGDANVLVFDTTKPHLREDSYAILDGSAIDDVNEWPVASRSFHEWLDHLVTAQGDKYWNWR